MLRHFVLWTLTFALFSLSGISLAGVNGPCSNCHTMHNSQDQLSMRFNVSATPLPLLLRGTCLECHTGSNTGSAGIPNAAPRVMGTTTPTYSWGDSAGISNGTLAGGNFWFVSTAPENGHNVVELFADDGPPPGGDPAWTGRLQCSGTNGCHGDPLEADPLLALRSAHHTDPGTSPDGTNAGDGTTVGQSYRYLLGALGAEDADWEWTVSSTDHNRYVGEARSSEINAPDPASISGQCAYCHETYHNTFTPVAVNPGIVLDSATFVTPWLRHPSDYDMTTAISADYAAYNAYNTQAPVARIASLINDGANDSVGAGKAVIMCLTCHRAHGSPYAAMLRWNLKAWPGVDPITGVVQDGCQVCHTSKN